MTVVKIKATRLVEVSSAAAVAAEQRLNSIVARVIKVMYLL